MKTLLKSAAFLLATLLVPQAQAQPKVPESLQQTYGKFASAMVNGEADKAIGFYADDAVVLVDTQHVYRGRSEIREGFLPTYLEASQGEDGPQTDIGVDRVVVEEGVVVLAGQYSSPVGTTGIYSNTWQRQEDEAWKLAISVMTFETTESAHASAGKTFTCTQVLGFSQSREWYEGVSLAGHMPNGKAAERTSPNDGTFLPSWQGRFYPGAAIEKWTDPAFPGWSGTGSKVYETTSHCVREEVDRVVFNVSGPARPPDEWAVAVVSVAELIRDKFPAVRQIVMQPVVGASEGKCRQIRAAQNHPEIVEGIRRAAEQADVVAGPSSGVTSCDQFRDQSGHLTGEGAQHVRRILREHYRRSSVVSQDERSAK